MPTIYSLPDLKRFHNEATKFFAAELMLLKGVMPRIDDDRTAKAGVLLMSCGNTGAALLLLANQTDSFTSESVMLARSFMEKVTNLPIASPSFPCWYKNLASTSVLARFFVFY